MGKCLEATQRVQNNSTSPAQQYSSTAVQDTLSPEGDTGCTVGTGQERGKDLGLGAKERQDVADRRQKGFSRLDRTHRDSRFNTETS